MKILCIDPGETTGWCVMDEKADVKDFGNAPGALVGIMEVLEKVSDIDHIVMEDYVILRGKAMSHSGSRVVPVQIIGMVKAWAIRKKIPVTLYAARLKNVQQKHSQVFPIGAHKHNHWVDAFNHGWWYCYKELKTVVSKLQAQKGVTPNGAA